MFDWLWNIFGRPDTDERQRLFDNLDALNADAGGGEPVATRRKLGRLKLRSNSLILSDPQFFSPLEIPNIASDEMEISASLWRYPSGVEMVTTLTLNMGEAASNCTGRKVGEVGIDSAKLVVADKADIEGHWSEIGKDRIGVISTAPDETVLRLLTKRFKLKTVRVNPIRAEVVGPVSEPLEKEIEDFLKADPKYANFPFIYFHVQTNNSFERANFMSKAWGFIPIGNNPDR